MGVYGLSQGDPELAATISITALLINVCSASPKLQNTLKYHGSLIRSYPKIPCTQNFIQYRPCLNSIHAHNFVHAQHMFTKINNNNVNVNTVLNGYFFVPFRHDKTPL